MATQVLCEEDDRDDEVSSQPRQRVAEFVATLTPGQDPDITPLSLQGDGPWEFSAGRDAARDIVIDSGSVSGHHADICAPAMPCPAPKPLGTMRPMADAPARALPSHRAALRRRSGRQGRAEEDHEQDPHRGLGVEGGPALPCQE